MNDYFINYQWPHTSPVDCTTKPSSLGIPRRLPRIDTRRASQTPRRGSAHVSIELDYRPTDDQVIITADCTSPPWQAQDMLYCGTTSTSKHLFTMLFENIPLEPVRFRMRTENEVIVEPSFYRQINESDGTISHVVEPWVLSDTTGLLTPVESERPPLLKHESCPEVPPCPSEPDNPESADFKLTMPMHERRRSHRRSQSVELTTTELQALGCGRPTPPITPIHSRLRSICEGIEDDEGESLMGAKTTLGEEDGFRGRHRKDSSLDIPWF